MRDLGSNIYSYRKMNNLSQEDLAVIVGVSAGAVSKWERGISVPDVDILIRLADYFEVSLDKLLGRGQSSWVDNYFNNQKDADRYYSALEILECCSIARKEGLLAVQENINNKAADVNPFLKFAVNYIMQGFNKQMSPAESKEYLLMYAESETDCSTAKMICEVIVRMFSGENETTVKEWLRAFLGRKYAHLIGDDELELRWKMSREDAIEYYSKINAGFKSTGVLDELESCDNVCIQQIIRLVDNDDLVNAMLGASVKIRHKFLANLSDRMIILVGEDMLKGTYDVERVTMAQEKVMLIWRTISTND